MQSIVNNGTIPAPVSENGARDTTNNNTFSKTDAALYDYTVELRCVRQKQSVQTLLLLSFTHKHIAQRRWLPLYSTPVLAVLY